ncbi:MAG: trypsin-like peptidase domain-containing protein [Lentisphaerae bacterium]|nr:trypsin-like peptidase domain-containing protein [Lentisphaerota bacterium]
MMACRLNLLALLAVGLVMARPAVADDVDLGRRLVRVVVTYQVSNPFLPWQSQAPSTRTGYGIQIGPAEVLTTEHLLRNHTHVELLHAREGEKITASVAIADKRLNLALLTIASPDHADTNLPTLELAGPLPLRTPVSVLQFDDDNDTQFADASVAAISVSSLPDSPYSMLTYALLAQLNVDGEGAPIVCSNQLAGLAISYQASTRIGTAIGHPFIARFLEDARRTPYLGPASGGFTWKPLVDPAKRAWLGLGPERAGILLVSTSPGTGASRTLQPRDVILEWDGRPLDAMGYYSDPAFGRLEFSHLVKGKASPGDHVPVTIWRDGTRQVVSLELGGDPDLNALVPENVTGEKAPYLVSGGLILRELDVFMLRALGQDWRAKADPEHLHYFIDGIPNQQPGDRVVVMLGILPDTINVGYQHLRNRVVTAVNGTPIRNMHDVFAVADRDGIAHRFTLKGLGVDLVLDREELAAANLRLARQYRIPALEYRGVAPQPAGPVEEPATR